MNSLDHQCSTRRLCNESLKNGLTLQVSYWFYQSWRTLTLLCRHVGNGLNLSSHTVHDRVLQTGTNTNSVSKPYLAARTWHGYISFGSHASVSISSENNISREIFLIEFEIFGRQIQHATTSDITIAGRIISDMHHACPPEQKNRTVLGRHSWCRSTVTERPTKVSPLLTLLVSNDSLCGKR